MTDEPSVSLGNCIRILDEVAEMVCNRPAVEEVLVRNRFGLFAVALCRPCFKEHKSFYAELRALSSRRVLKERRESQSRGRVNGSGSATQLR